MATAILVGSLLASAGSAGATLAGATAVAGTLATVATVGTIASTLLAGREAAFASEVEARQHEQAGEREKLAASQRETERLRKLQSVLATQNAIFASRNVSIASGTPQTIAGESIEQKKRESSIDNLNTGLLVNQSTSRAKQSRIAGGAAFKSSIASSGQTLIGYANTINKRGGPAPTTKKKGS